MVSAQIASRRRQSRKAHSGEQEGEVVEPDCIGDEGAHEPEQRDRLGVCNSEEEAHPVGRDKLPLARTIQRSLDGFGYGDTCDSGGDDQPDEQGSRG